MLLSEHATHTAAPDDDPLKRALAVCDLVFTVLFTLEALLKMTQTGFIGRPPEDGRT